MTYDIEIDEHDNLIGGIKLAYTCPRCECDWYAPVTMMQIAALSNLAGDRALTARLEALAADPPSALCPACAIRYGQEAP